MPGGSGAAGHEQQHQPGPEPRPAAATTVPRLPGGGLVGDRRRHQLVFAQGQVEQPAVGGRPAPLRRLLIFEWIELPDHGPQVHSSGPFWLC